jgi:hypothetical protein
MEQVLSPNGGGGSGVDIYAEAAMGAEAEMVQLTLRPCGCCGRKFAEARLPKHEVACKKSQAAKAKRKVFDQSKARLAGTDAAQFAGKTNPKADAAKIAKAAEKKKNWKAKSEAFRAAMRAARDPTAAPVAAVENPDFVKCPHCARSFSEGAAERHIPKCNSAKPGGGGGGSANKKGKARVKYDPRKKSGKKR